MTDYLLKANDYGEEATVAGGEEFVLVTTNILFNKRGFIPELPDLGLDLDNRKYIFVNDTASMTSMEEEALYMIRKYYPDDIINVEVVIKYDNIGRPFLSVVVNNASRGVSATVTYYSASEKSVDIEYKDYNK